MIGCYVYWFAGDEPMSWFRTWEPDPPEIGTVGRFASGRKAEACQIAANTIVAEAIEDGLRLPVIVKEG